MTGNRLLDYLLEFGDDNTAICELLELIKKDSDSVIRLCEDKIPNLNNLCYNSILLITKLVTILEYKFGINKLPNWTFDKRLYLDKPLFIGERLDDFTKTKMFIFASQAFLNRNIYFNEDGLNRI